MKSWMFAAAAIALAGCAGDSPSRMLFDQHVTTATRQNFVFCGEYGCHTRWDMTLTDAEWDRVRAVFEPPPRDAAEERQRMALAVGLIERIIGPKTGTDIDKPGATILFASTKGQLDCIDEAHNTALYLTFMQRDGLFKWHTVGEPIIRGHVIDRWFHNTATVIETATGTQWVIDSWFGANGEPADVTTAKIWESGWEPEKYKTRTDR
ncbi:MAG: hypothetical protein GC201_06930 [Alphaproteobacteria bacterium]|nr:hypothetical protein [Alphaproteobacteria bacterium]